MYKRGWTKNNYVYKFEIDMRFFRVARAEKPSRQTHDRRSRGDARGRRRRCHGIMTRDIGLYGGSRGCQGGCRDVMLRCHESDSVGP